jgi:hypothetical protein
VPTDCPRHSAHLSIHADHGAGPRGQLTAGADYLYPAPLQLGFDAVLTVGQAPPYPVLNSVDVTWQRVPLSRI